MIDDEARWAELTKAIRAVDAECSAAIAWKVRNGKSGGTEVYVKLAKQLRLLWPSAFSMEEHDAPSRRQSWYVPTAAVVTSTDWSKNGSN
jgi:hypothetical protein